MSARKPPGTIIVVGPGLEDLYSLLNSAAARLELLMPEYDRVVVQPGGKANLHVPQIYALEDDSEGA